MKSVSTLLTLTALAATSALAQMSQPMVDENQQHDSDQAGTFAPSLHAGRLPEISLTTCHGKLLCRMEFGASSDSMVPQRRLPREGDVEL